MVKSNRVRVVSTISVPITQASDEDVSHVSRDSHQSLSKYATVVSTPVPTHFLKYDLSCVVLVSSVESFTDDDHFLLLYHHMNFLQYVMNRFVFYLQDFSVSSDQTWDEKRIQHFRGTYGPDELYRLENDVYTL